MAAKAQTESEADLENSAKTEPNVLAEKDQNLTEKLEQQEDHEKEFSPPHQIHSEEYCASKPAYGTKSINNNIHLGEQQNDRERDYSPPYQTKEYDDAAKTAYYYIKSIYGSIHLDEQQDDCEEELGPLHQSEDYDTAEPVYYTKYINELTVKLTVKRLVASVIGSV